jgi:acyl-CoA synthetase (NDP forming)
MKSITEFWNFTLVKGINAKNALAAEGKTLEEIQTAIGETFKLEGDKLKHFVNAIEVAAVNLEKLSRVLVVSLLEGETAPPKATKIEEHHYVPDFQIEPKAVAAKKADARGGQQNKKKTGQKESPWGLSPEQKAAKKGAQSKQAKQS